jgi:hypothetical protein
MSASITRRRVAATLAASLGLALAPGAGAAEQEYVPFVTDFPKRASAQQYVPFVTDFGLDPRVPGRTVVIGPLRPVAAPVPVAEPAGGRSWADVGLGAAMGVGLATLLALAAAGARRLRGWDEAGVAEAPSAPGAAH